MADFHYGGEIILQFLAAEPTQSTGTSVVHKTPFGEENAIDLFNFVEQIQTEADLKVWLTELGCPVDGWEQPYDGTYDDILLAAMLKEINAFRQFYRAYSILLSAPENGEKSIYGFINAASCVMLPEAFDDESRRLRMAKLEELLPEEMLDRAGYTDDCIELLLGYIPGKTNALVCGRIIASIWVDIVHNYHEKLSGEYGYSSRAYSPETATADTDTSAYVEWWDNPDLEAQAVIYLLFCAFYKKIEKALSFYQRHALKGAVFPSDYYPGSWRTSISAYEQKRRGLTFTTVHEMLQWLESDLKNVSHIMHLAMDDILNQRLQSVEITINSIHKTKQLYITKIVDGLYACLAEELLSGGKYRKCLLCDRYFKIGNRPKRKYCTVHQGANAEYHRRKLNKKIATEKEEDGSL